MYIDYNGVCLYYLLTCRGGGGGGVGGSEFLNTFFKECAYFCLQVWKFDSIVFLCFWVKNNEVEIRDSFAVFVLKNVLVDIELKCVVPEVRVRKVFY